ncbi:MAG: glycosyltransferase family 4 protein [Planctomycetota bacterium]|nr:glycosyltransferase family 4 protein [Planctomycetota bacterium]
MDDGTDNSFVFVLPDPGDVISGGHLYNQRITQALRGKGCRVERIELPQAGGRMASSASRYVFDSLYLDPKSLVELSRLPLENSASIFLAHHLHSLFPPDGRAAEAVFAEHEWPQLRRFSHCWATSPFMAEYLIANGVESRRVVTVEPALEEVQPGRLELQDPPRVLVVANLIARKGVLEFLSCLASKSELPTFELRILGGDLEPDYARSCRELAADNPALASRVVFAGTRLPDEMPAEYRSGDLFVSVAVVETFGMASQEAMAHGLPLLLREGGYSGRHLAGRGAGEVHATVEELVVSMLGLLNKTERLVALKRAAHAARPAGRTWTDAAVSLLEQLSID